MGISGNTCFFRRQGSGQYFKTESLLMSFVTHTSHTGLTKTGLFSDKRQACQHAPAGTVKPSEEKSECREISEKNAGTDNCGLKFAEVESENIRPESRCGFATGTDHEFAIRVID